MEAQHFFVFLLSLLVLQVELVDCEPVMADLAPRNDIERKAVKTEEEGARGNLPDRNYTWSTSDTLFLEENGDFMNPFPTQPDGGKESNDTMVEPGVKGTSTNTTMDHGELEKSIHELNMKLLQSVFIFLGAVAATAGLVTLARKWMRNRTRMFRCREPNTVVDAENLRVRFCNLHLDNYL